jgi:rubrerythrin
MSDLEVLQYASTLENLEAALYEQALARFTAKDFASAGFADWVRSRVSQIAEHESSHNSVPPCQYTFPFEDPATFVGFATAIENIGVSAYVGANQYISDPLYRTIAASILSVEARHQGFFNGPVLLRNDWR